MAESQSTKMANKFVVFLVFVAVVHASLASLSIKEAQKITSSKWKEAAKYVYDAIENPTSCLKVAKKKYLQAGKEGGAAFVGVAPAGSDQNLLKAASDRYQLLDDLVFDAIQTARKINKENSAISYTQIKNDRSKLPLKEGVNADFQLAKKPKASQKDALRTLADIYNEYWKSIQSLADFKLGKCDSIDTSSRKSTDKLIDKFVGEIYGLLKSKKD